MMVGLKHKKKIEVKPKIDFDVITNQSKHAKTNVDSKFKQRYPELHANKAKNLGYFNDIISFTKK